MSEWRTVTVADIAASTRNALVGGPFGSNLVSRDYVEFGVPVIRGQNMGARWISGEFVYVTPEKAASLESNIAQPGDIVFTQRGTLGQVAIVPDATYDRYLISQSQMKLTVNRKIADPLFFYYVFQSDAQQEYIRQHAIQTGVPHTNLGILRSTPVPLPPLAVQRAIARILGELDDKIELNRQINQTLEQMAKTIFKSWFVDFEPVKAKMKAKADGRDPERAAMCSISGKNDVELDLISDEQRQQLVDIAALFPDEVEGDILKGWETKKVEAILSRLSTKVRYTKDQVKPDGLTPVFEQGAGILLGYHDGSAHFQATPEDPAFIFGDHTCVTHLACEPFDISQNVIPLKGSDRPTAWVYYAVKDKQAFQEYRRHWMELVSKNVVVPPEPICGEFAKSISSLLLAMEANVRQSRTLTTIRDTLLSKLLSGELPLESLQSNLEGNEG